jgi:DegV family protein with EDD domain
MGYRIVTDSGSDLSACMAKELDVDLVSLHSVMKNSKGDETIDGNALALSEVYALLRQRYSATTSAVNVDAFTEIFETVLKQGEDVLYLGLSSGLSATFHASELAAEDLREKYPDRKLIVIDTLAASLGLGMLVYYAAQKRNAGSSIDEVADFIREKIPHTCHWFTVDDLFFLKRGGRVSATTAIVGTALGIKPVMHVDDEGHLIKKEIARGRKKSLAELCEKLKKTIVDPEEQTIFISHGDCLADAEYLADLIRRDVPVKEIAIDYIGSVIGTHSGPGTVALFFLGTNR